MHRISNIISAHDKSSDSVSRNFPFTVFFNTHLVHKTLFNGSFTEDYAAATECYHYLQKLFSELAQYRPLEIIRGAEERAKFVVDACKVAVAVVGQTKAFENYDSIVVEEAHNMLQFDTLFHGHMKRLLLIGDESAPTTSTRNGTLRNFSHLDLSLFHRVCRLELYKAPIRLTDQGRLRPSLASVVPIFTSSLTHTTLFDVHNAGFSFDHQIINVGDYTGKGESLPRSGAWVNLGEAEYIVAVYMYMRYVPTIRELTISD
jgi:intron-binding protein aquarius